MALFQKGKKKKKKKIKFFDDRLFDRFIIAHVNQLIDHQKTKKSFINCNIPITMGIIFVYIPGSGNCVYIKHYLKGK